MTETWISGPSEGKVKAGLGSLLYQVCVYITSAENMHGECISLY